MSTTQERRLRVRRVDEVALVEHAKAKAAETQQPVICVRHGGTVANKYPYPASTECVLVVAFPDGRYWQSDVERIPANKTTYGGACAACGGPRELFDERYSEAHQIAARERFLAEIEPFAE